MIEQLVDQLYEDLEAMSKFFISKDPLPPSHVRIVAASTLRKWLAESLINKLSSLNGVGFTFLAYDTSDIVDAVKDNTNVTFFVAGGINLDGKPIRGIYASESPAPPNGKTELPVKMPLKHYTPSEFLKSKRIYYRGQWFDTESIIRFVANKLGGVHLDAKREIEWQKMIEEAANFFVAGNPDHLDSMQLIEPYSDKHQVLLVLPKEKGIKWNCLDIEMLAIAQAFLHIHADGDPIISFNKEVQ